jgi:spermidine synthase
MLFKLNSPLISYILNVSGGMTGILLMILFSVLKINPLYQFVALLIVYLILIFEKKPVLVVQIIVCFIILFFIYNNDKNSIWSPYHKITISPLQYDGQTGTLREKYIFAQNDRLVDLPDDFGFNISINDDYFQKALNLSDEYVNKFGYLKAWRENYDLPFRLKKSKKVLIIGGGVGNDAAGAIRSGAEIIDVVEIEGEIVNIGRAGHPEFPYSNPKVNVIIDDARSFFNRTKNRYDLIIFSYVDSHRLFSHMSSVRLDSFLYTQESFEESRKLLTDDGILFVNCSLSKTWVEQRINKMLDRVFDKKSMMINGVISPAFVNGNTGGLNTKGIAIDVNPSIPSDTSAASDDWPYIYLKDRSVPTEYMVTILLIAAIIISLMLVMMKKFRIGVSRDSAFFFIIGFSFFLLESKNITDIALLFGSTWNVNSIVILSVLFSILLSNMIVLKCGDIKVKIIFVLLFLFLTTLFFFPLRTMTHLNLPIKIFCSIFIIGLPIFFSSLIFCHYFKSSHNPEIDFGVNIIGSIFGGFFEYISLITGFKFLLIVIIGCYLVLFSLKYLRIKIKP